MKELNVTGQIDSMEYEIYDQSCPDNDTLIWLSSEEEEFPVFDDSVEPLAILPIGLQIPLQTDLLETFSEQQVIPETLPQQSTKTQSDLQFLPLPNSSTDAFGETACTAPPLTHGAGSRRIPRQWLFRIAALVGVLLIGSMLPPILERVRQTRVKASAAAGDPSRGTETAVRPGSTPLRILTVMAGREESLKGISLQYVGHFDKNLYEEICALNPGLKDPDHLEDGQLIRIPLRPRKSVN